MLAGSVLPLRAAPSVLSLSPKYGLSALPILDPKSTSSLWLSTWFAYLSSTCSTQRPKDGRLKTWMYFLGGAQEAQPRTSSPTNMMGTAISLRDKLGLALTTGLLPSLCSLQRYDASTRKASVNLACRRTASHMMVAYDCVVELEFQFLGVLERRVSWDRNLHH